MDRVTRNAQRVDGVEKVQVDLKSKTATVTYDPAKTSPEAIAAAIKAGGDAVTTTELQQPQ